MLTGRRRGPAAALALLLIALGGGCRGGCSRATTAPAPTMASPLSWFPADTHVVLSIDFARLRTTPLWSALGGLATTDPADRQRIEDLAKRTGLDPLKQVDSLIVAFPEEARAQGSMGLILRGQGLDEARLVAYVRDQVGKQGDDLFSFRRAGRTLWATRREPTTAGFFVDDRTFVLGAGGWAEKMADLSAEPNAKGASTNPTLVHLVEQAGPSRAVWAVALVPAATRAALAADPTVPGAAGVNRLSLGIDIGTGVDAKLVADLATHAEAEAMAQQVRDAVVTAKRSPQVLLLGLAPYLDGISSRAAGVGCELSLRLSDSQTNDAIERLRALLTLARQPGAPGFPRPF
ncbi:MAG TPA: hypothetical protein VHU40_07375 [Polyangia bacterium]|nr:hypothetical protein [Polyangia bacterium]